MNPNYLLRKAIGRHALLTLSHLSVEEIYSIVPTNYATAKDLEAVEHQIADLREKLETKTSADRTVTWNFFRWFLGGVLTVVVIFYTVLLPEKIETVISSSQSLSKRFDKVDERFGKLDDKLEGISNDIKEINIARDVSSSLKEAVSVPEAALAMKLPEIKKLTQRIITEKLPIPARDFRVISRPLADHYQNSKPPLKQELWGILIGLTNARSISEAQVNPPSEAEIADAGVKGNYRVGENIDLSEKTEWKDVIFNRCTITMGKPENKLTLTGVRFLACDFQLQPDNGRRQSLLTAVLESDSPQINETIAVFRVERPTYRFGKRRQN